MRKWTWSKGWINVDGEPVVWMNDFWLENGDERTEEIAEFIVNACNEKEAREAVKNADRSHGPFVNDSNYIEYPPGSGRMAIT